MSATEFSIRPFAAADIAAITEIYAHHVRHGASSWELTPPDAAEMQRRADALLAAGYPYLVARDAARVLGYAYVGAYRPRPAYRYTVEHSIYIADDVRRGGVGRRLMTALIAVCTERGYRQMVAIIGDSKNAQSIEFHEKLGFRHAGKIENIGYKFERWMDQVLMQLPLGDGATSKPRGA